MARNRVWQPQVLLSLIGALILGFFLLNVQAHDDSDDNEDSDEHSSRWVFECDDRVKGCSEGGLLYHTEDGPDGDVYFIAHYGDTGNVYARRVRFE